ncbi:SusC/RagA family TonB-linked outer membrane protein [Pedobacter punctiformis]|uniref:SusC/RagA family TonB-linked outer membrane protein n=1 Tax=Pedobacter punctiformis TaxID=3004097 RepID=A0ABT4LC13_9SPHI|nr:SusC/RagA family TonB-linked outer membrane protein [Pedobacter sp. HCMS5-2]MCZ4245455.1 SusC/RagA family TonB-linked outer membrane protein [Pedobacter sp. HCMS5-2]
MKKSLQLTCLLLYASTSLYAAEIVNNLKPSASFSAFYQDPVKGTVKDATGTTVPGVTVSVKGAQLSTQTNASGQYTIQAKAGDVLVFSSIGYQRKEITVGTQSVINVTLTDDSNDLETVVVTALGITRQARTLTYATQTIKSEDINNVKTPNLINSLNGKVAGVQINRTSGGAGGSARITLRGDKSTRNSQPLFVIDGMPILNPTGGPNVDIYSSMPDNGDILSTMNPEDIESVNFLKGASASALYGSAGSNGVILITTRKGKNGVSKFDFSSSVTFDRASVLPELQYSYLQTTAPTPASGAIDATAGSRESWGAKGTSPDYVDDFFQTGATWVNSVNFTSGNERSNNFFSYSNTANKGIVPTSKFDQNTINFRNSSKFFNDKLTLDANFMGSLQKVLNRSNPGTYFNPLTGLYLFPRGLDFDNYKNNYEYASPSRYLNAQNWWNLNLDKKFTGSDEQQNPYWILNRNPITTNNKNAYAAVSLNYAINNWLSVQTRGNYNYYYSEAERDVYATTSSVISGTNGKVYNNKLDSKTFYGDLLLLGNKNLNKDFNLGFTLGASISDSKKLNTTLENGFLSYPNIFAMSNLIFPGTNDNGRHLRLENHHIQTQSLFASAQIGYKNKLFLDLTDRQEWSSTLAFTPQQTYNYYSIGANAILTDLFKFPTAVNFAKIRASYATVGNGIEDNRTNPQPNIDAGTYVGPDGAPVTVGGLYLRPEQNQTIEIGTEWRLLNNKLSLDVTWYKSNIKHQFFKDVSITGGVAAGTKGDISAGNIQNTGLEATLSYKAFVENDFKWTTGLNFSRNKNKIVQLFPSEVSADPNAKYTLSGGGLNYLKQGGSFGDIYGATFKRNAAGNVIVDANGAPERDEKNTYLGNPNPKAIIGWNNSFSYKNFTLNVLVDGKFGGKVLSLSEPYYDAAGVSKRSADARDAGGVTVSNAVTESGTAWTGTTTAQNYYTAISGGGKNVIHEAYMYSATAIRLRELSIAYRVPVKSKVLHDLTLSAIGSNLFFFKKDAPFDPEQVSGVNAGGVGVDVFGAPAYRSIGFSLKCGF